MKLVFFELNKVLNKKVFYIFIVLCLLINSFLLYSTQNVEDNRTRLDYSGEYIDALNKYSKLSFKDAQKAIANDTLAYSIATTINLLPQLDSKDEIEYYTSELEEYKVSNPAAYKKALEISENQRDDMHGYQLVNKISTQIDYIKSYPEFIGDMHSRADDQSKLAGFSDINSFSYKNLYKTADDYAHLKNTEISLLNAEPVTAAIDFKVTDIIIIAVVFLVCIYLFNFERDKSLYFLVKCTSKGRLSTIIAKLIALFITVLIAVLIFDGSNFALSSIIYGSTDLSASIQSIPEFRNCAFSLNILEFELIFVLFKIVAALVTASFIAFVFIAFSSPFLMYAVGVGTLGAEYMLYSFINSGSTLDLIKYINIFYIFDGGEFIGHYLNLDLFSNAVTANAFVTIFFAVCFAAFLCAACVQFCVRIQQKKAGLLSKSFEKIKTKFCKIKGSTSVFIGELFKFLIQNKMAVIFILLAVYAVYSSIGVVRYPFIEPSDYQYKVYMEYLSGDITPEKEKYIADEQKYLDSLERKIGKIYADDSLTDNAKQAMARSVQNIIDGKQDAYERVLEEYDRLKSLKKQGVEARFIDGNVYSVFVSSDVREWNNFITFCLFIIIVIPCIFTVEYKNKMINLIRPTKKGKLRLFWSKILISFIATFYVFASVCLPYIIRFIGTYGTDSFKTPLVCLYSNLPASQTLTVIDAFILNQTIYFCLALLVMCVTIAFSIVAKNNLYVMIICTVMLAAPSLACYSVETVRIGYLMVNNNVSALVLTAIISVLTITTTLFMSEKKFTNSLIRRKYAYS